MTEHVVSEIWGELKRYINTVDRADAAETVVQILMDSDCDAEDIRDAFKGDRDIKTALIKSSEAEQVESVKQSLQAADVVKATTEQVKDAIESAESITSKPVTSIKIKPTKTKQSKSTKT